MEQQFTYVLDNEVRLTSEQFHLEKTELRVNGIQFIYHGTDGFVFL